MSLINQMLRDLEQRRTAEAGVSPLGGLSASGTPTQTINFSMNYVTLAVVVTVAVGVVIAYLLGMQQRPVDMLVKGSMTAQDRVQTKPVGNVPVIEPVVAPVTVPVTVSVKRDQLIAEKKMSTHVMQETLATAEKKVKVVKNTVAVRQVVATVQEKDVAVVEEPASIVVVKAVTEDAGKPTVATDSPINTEEDFNKTIRPLTADEQSQLAFQHAVKMLGRGKQQAAKLALEKSLSFAPTHLRARETLAALLLNEGRVAEAASSLREGLRLMAGATSLAKLYARILVDQGDIPMAVTVLERARPAVSADPEYHALLAALYRQQKKYAQAAHAYQQILMQRPGVASWWMGLALSEDAMGESAPALNAFQRAQRAGGLSATVMKYLQARIVALTPVAPVPVTSSNNSDDFGE